MKFMRFVNEQIVWQEVPGETSLAYTITGCPLRCKGCHSSEYRNPKIGEPLYADYFQSRLNAYKGLISCVVFFWWRVVTWFIATLLEQARRAQLNTCLYTGFDLIPNSLLPHLTYLKTGAWIAARAAWTTRHQSAFH